MLAREMGVKVNGVGIIETESLMLGFREAFGEIFGDTEAPGHARPLEKRLSLNSKFGVLIGARRRKPKPVVGVSDVGRNGGASGQHQDDEPSHGLPPTSYIGLPGAEGLWNSWDENHG